MWEIIVFILLNPTMLITIPIAVGGSCLIAFYATYKAIFGLGRLLKEK